MNLLRLFTGLSALVIATPALAHHPMGGETPGTIMDGLLSGIGHPIIGLDHLAFVVAVGIAAALTPHRFVLPLAFIVATVAGTLIHLAAVSLPFPEAVIALSVAAIGFVILSGRDVGPLVLGGLFAVAGLFHGFAYGEAVFGAETTPVLVYLAGFAVTQYLIAIAAGHVVVEMIGKGLKGAQNTPARLSGAMVAGAGCLIVGEQAIAAMFG